MLLIYKGNMNALSHNNLSRQRGATLIEALVSILLFSLGLLGLAGLQVNALAFQKSSWATNRIAEISIDIGERMRANPAGVELGGYLYTADYATGKAATITSNSCRTTSAGASCTGLQIANDDLSDWLTKAQTALPRGSVQLTGSAALGYTVTVMYLDKEFTDTATAGNALLASTTCSSTSTGTAWRNCCPSSASVPDGVKCSRSFVLPFTPE
jgi:type IV pilus assembly protein PilV